MFILIYTKKNVSFSYEYNITLRRMLYISIILYYIDTIYNIIYYNGDDIFMVRKILEKKHSVNPTPWLSSKYFNQEFT